jgi:predicted nuclease with TOPRIM domain
MAIDKGKDIMRERLEQRLSDLKSEFEAGQRMLAELEAKQANLKETLLRISGAIQVLEEELGKGQDATADSSQPPEMETPKMASTAQGNHRD